MANITKKKREIVLRKQVNSMTSIKRLRKTLIDTSLRYFRLRDRIRRFKDTFPEYKISIY
ncbi:MAG: hypothetical protein G01um101417_466 [Parcubacteria group bacterium Gr01-1014_17]|nr:MAG: hypothetical protein G01um101417_466 [Parcubacteria group bacterium Gr01-1014_17]